MVIANTTIQVRKSGITGVKPTSLANGELALNYADNKLYYKNNTGDISYFYGANNGPGFATANVDGTLLLASAPNDTISFVGANGLSVTACTITKTITIDGNLDYSTANSAASFANGAFTRANAVYELANTLISGSIDTYAREEANSAYNVAITNFNAFTDTYGNTISGTTSQSVQFVAGNNITIFANASTSQITISANASTGTFPFLDMGLVSTSLDPLSGALDLGALS